MENKVITILGSGNIGLSIAKGLVNAQLVTPKKVILTRRNTELLKDFSAQGFSISSDNKKAVTQADIVIIAVQPQQLNDLLLQIKPVLKAKKHTVISVVSGATVSAIKKILGGQIKIVRAMPNTAIAIQESMTCLSSDSPEALTYAEKIFDALGKSLVIKEELMGPATALCACGIAFFLRAIRAASQGGIEIGFHSEEAIMMAAQTAKGAAALLLVNKNHPESEVDKVTTPRGITISGLNQMEHNGFSSALIKGIVTSAEKAAKIYS
ncbi:MAG: pyrroline-5-carboxylate reductase [Ignavibacteria bacterium CG_4_8_14_3_um_filter_37_9]|nr:pyrroline-5-carboxylate reductase [Ignavibacteria bacterium]OIO15835.1 MAG: pyrroline-5-carboxylate reductase [Ignavibacteria bacterium CG1_02_37_35]PIP77168.1 MAG: pyrroline-5-carboxylate reductase [Ignavibacteria bacterium CG22_combo_CG10-13_8_21_14_all_37_15]PIS46132.1 MAG: pyrroline-5-carboxylate reductase [Ignavibacteria bacterium CG08_land_8_20_14_0_20_37_9]PIW99990.1 MAG: pyrroline-5-carboxylate reductase [Ignavibacteria bacterium CG_4_8_14_3_um_filter_37_9]PIX93071.1 MAG: pyrroline-